MGVWGTIWSIVTIPSSYFRWAEVEPQSAQLEDHESCAKSDFYPAKQGDLLHTGSYKLLLKVGGGVYSSTYLAQDIRCSSATVPTYVAIKILTRDATEQCNDKTMLEPEIMRKIRGNGGHELLPRLLNEFTTEDGAHYCMVMSLLGSDFATFRRTSPTKSLPPYIVRHVLRQVTEAVVHIHKLGIVHTDIKPDNILFHLWMREEQITQWVKERHLEQFDESHPLPVRPGVKWDCDIAQARQIKVSLIDFGQAQFAGKDPTVDQFSAFSLRAPEVILKSEFTPAIDVWALGCLAFEMLVGRWLFHPVDGGEDWCIEDDHLAKMIEFTGESFPSRMWNGPYAQNFFDPEGNLRRVSELFPVAIEDALRNYKILSEQEIQPAADFIRACIRIDPSQRLTAEQLLQHPWLSGI